MNYQKARSLICFFLRKSTIGLTRQELVSKARSKGLTSPMRALRRIIREDGFARVDEGKNGRPTRIKATKKLFQSQIGMNPPS